MGRNAFAVNTSAVNSINQNGVPPVYATTPPITAGWRALRHEAMIAKAGSAANLKTLDGNGFYGCSLALKGLKGEAGSTPIRHRLRSGYVSPVALARSGFTGQIKTGDVLVTAKQYWHVNHAHLQEESGENLRWVLELEESGTR